MESLDVRMCDVHLERKKAKQLNKAQAKSGVQVCVVPVICHVVYLNYVHLCQSVHEVLTASSLSVHMPNVEKFSFSGFCLSLSTNRSGESSYCSRLTSVLSDRKAKYISTSMTLSCSLFMIMFTC